MLRQIERLAGWQRAGRHVGYFDEEYATSQMWQADWERHRGDELATIAHHVAAATGTASHVRAGGEE